MDNGAILNVDIISNPDIMHITTNHSIEPHTAIITHFNFAHDGGILGEKTIFSIFWTYAINCSDQCHNPNFYRN
jgi:hypothetical protein